jgi:hypothetical protein
MTTLGENGTQHVAPLIRRQAPELEEHGSSLASAVARVLGGRSKSPSLQILFCLGLSTQERKAK